MAEMTAGPGAGPSMNRAGVFVNAVGAVVSVGLVIGLGVWGYKLMMRDVSGIPVVRALEGDMRVRPENPGGEIALHTGLAVNAVPGEGGAAAPEDRLVLAPSQPALDSEDLQVAPAIDLSDAANAELAEQVAVSLGVEEAEPAAPTPSIQIAGADGNADNQPLSAADILALADQMAAGTEPLTELAEGEDVPVQVAINGVTLDPGRLSPSVPGVTRSLRPFARPANLSTRRSAAPVAAPVVAVAAPAATTAPELTGPLPAGTKLVQLGAFDSAEIAASEWVRLSARFEDFLDGKERVIQVAQSGGREFYRLRAMGFDDLSGARRLCAALVAENAQCIPVVVR